MMNIMKQIINNIMKQIYADLECLIEKTDRCKNNPENPSSTKLGEHVPSNFSMSKISSFNSIKKTSMVYAEVKIV